MLVLGIDPGLKTVGLGLVESRNAAEPRARDWLTIETDAGLAFSSRLGEIASDLGAYLDDHRPDLVVVEKIFMQTNRKTAFDVAHGRGAIVAEIGRRGIPLLEPTPLELKSAITGDGNADKKQMQDMVARILALDARPTPDDAADALALALYGCFHRVPAGAHAPA